MSLKKKTSYLKNVFKMRAENVKLLTFDSKAALFLT